MLDQLNIHFIKLRCKYGIFWPLILGFISLSLVFCYGLFIYWVVEGWTIIESFYQVVITLSTVGFTEVHPLSNRGRILTSILILLGVGNFAYLVGTFSQLLVEGRLQMLLGRRRVQKLIASLKNHFIICGYGRIGSVVAGEILREGNPVVVVENDPKVLAELEKSNILYINGDATSDEHLIAAGIKHAKVLIAGLNQEAENVYVTLTARQLNPKLTIIARAEREDSIRKLEFAGADRVLTPHLIGGLRMAQVVLRPTVVDFLDLAIHGGNLELQMEELAVSEGSPIAHKDLIDSQIRPRFNLIIIAIKKSSGEMIFNPQPKTVIHPGDTLVAVGRKENLTQLQAIL